ncbi:hypothetical protein [Vibrio phage VP4B]|uniref:Uncharacterized protein n=1 Tax=Vibrio phage VP4B TaxID=1262540 RepID=V9LZR3_9CAUD|nr:hypothetical protein FDJ61_gp081 [Vibrio phage VP4B]AGB07195.1 hypothetical protein [Vibrio phage VP4B]
MSHLNIVKHRRMVIFKKKDITLGVIKLLRSLKKRPEKKRFLLVEYGRPIHDHITPKYAVLKLKCFEYDDEGNLTASVTAADSHNPTVNLGNGKVSLGQLLLSSEKPTFSFVSEMVKRPVQKDGQPVIDEKGRQQFFNNCLIYVEPEQKPILSVSSQS